LHTVTLTNTDCNNNDITDSTEIAGHDCNGDFILDSCNARFDTIEDCNNNGLGDTCEKELTLALHSGHLSPIGFNANQTWTIPSAVRAQSPITLVIRGHGDFSGLQEYVRVKVGPALTNTPYRTPLTARIPALQVSQPSPSPLSSSTPQSARTVRSAW
jgi:hypothetical protein